MGMERVRAGDQSHGIFSNPHERVLYTLEVRVPAARNGSQRQLSVLTTRTAVTATSRRCGRALISTVKIQFCTNMLKGTHLKGRYTVHEIILGQVVSVVVAAGPGGAGEE